jgi:glucose/mannose-6-phosphate isomerase
LTRTEIVNSINDLEKLQKQINSTNLDKSNPALDIATWITGLPMILYPYGFQAAAIRFKNSLQENTKNHAIIEDVIEFCHNGIVSWEKKSDVFPILIEGKDDHAKTKERWMILKEFFQQNNIEYKEIISIEGSILSKLVTLVYLLDYATIYKAVLDKIDPSPVKPIDFIKQRLKE